MYISRWAVKTRILKPSLNCSSELRYFQFVCTLPGTQRVINMILEDYSTATYQQTTLQWQPGWCNPPLSFPSSTWALLIHPKFPILFAPPFEYKLYQKAKQSINIETLLLPKWRISTHSKSSSWRTYDQWFRGTRRSAQKINDRSGNVRTLWGQEETRM